MRLQYTPEGAVVDGGDFYGLGYTSLGQMRASIARRACLVGKIMGIRIAVSEYNLMLVRDDPSDFDESGFEPPAGNGDGTRLVPLSDGNLWVFCEGGRDLSEFWKKVDGK
jgi:hypothetical protein